MADSIQYPAWVSNEKKYERAVNQLKAENRQLVAEKKPEIAITEDRIKALYVKWAGLVLDVSTPEPVQPVEAPKGRRPRAQQ